MIIRKNFIALIAAVWSLPVSAFGQSEEAFYLSCEIENTEYRKQSSIKLKVSGSSIYQFNEFSGRYFDVCENENSLRINCYSIVTDSEIKYAFDLPYFGTNIPSYTSRVEISRFSDKYGSIGVHHKDKNVISRVGMCSSISSPEILERKF